MNWLSEQLNLGTAVQIKIGLSILVLIVAVLLRFLISRAVHRRVDDSETIYRTSKLVTYASTLVALIALAIVWVDQFANLATYLAVVSAGLAIALADVLKNIAGWAYVVLRRPFRVGDRIEIEHTKGDVIDIRLFRFTVAEVGNWVDAEQSTGRIIHIPNGTLFSAQVANYTEGFEFVWHEIPVLITFESNWRRCEEILLEIARTVAPDIEARAGARIRETARNYHIKLGILRPTVYLTVKDSGILLTVRSLTDPRERRAIEQNLWRAALEAFEKEPEIELAYPTVRTHLQGPVSFERSSI